MTQHDPVVTVRQMIDCVTDAVRLSHGKSLAALDQDQVLTLALTRLVEVAGEAANRLPTEMRMRYSEIPWREMIGMRNVLIHGYDIASVDILHAVVTQDLPRVLPRLEQMLVALSGDSP